MLCCAELCCAVREKLGKIRINKKHGYMGVGNFNWRCLCAKCQYSCRRLRRDKRRLVRRETGGGGGGGGGGDGGGGGGGGGDIEYMMCVSSYEYRSSENRTLTISLAAPRPPALPQM